MLYDGARSTPSGEERVPGRLRPKATLAPKAWQLTELGADKRLNSGTEQVELGGLGVGARGIDQPGAVVDTNRPGRAVSQPRRRRIPRRPVPRAKPLHLGAEASPCGFRRHNSARMGLAPAWAVLV